MHPLPFLCRNLSSRVAAISIRWVPKRDLRQQGSFVAAGRSHPISGVMHLDLTDEEDAALIKELADIAGNNRYPFSSRIRTLRAILGKLVPPVPQPEPRPPVRPGMGGPSVGRGRRRYR